ncbi:MAG: hypothetical protein GXX08_05445 [Firmicutes bacterium]|nr:hypothetical protein [Bacillota bacterium]
MTGQQKDLVSRFVTPEQLEALVKLKESLRPEEIDELKSAGERLLKDVKTEKDLANLIESAAKTGGPPDIKSPRLRSIIKGMASNMPHQGGEPPAGKKSTRSAASGCGSCSAGSRKRRSVRKKV